MGRIIIMSSRNESFDMQEFLAVTDWSWCPKINGQLNKMLLEFHLWYVLVRPCARPDMDSGQNKCTTNQLSEGTGERLKKNNKKTADRFWQGVNT